MESNKSFSFDNLIPAFPIKFFGRRAELVILAENQPQNRVFFVHGEAGIGKSALISKFVKENYPEKKLFYKRIEKEETLFLAMQPILDKNFEDFKTLFETLNNFLNEEDQLLFLDDFNNFPEEDEEILINYLANYYSGKTKIFIASRNPVPARFMTIYNNFFVLQLSSLDEKSSQAILKEVLKRGKNNNEFIDNILAISAGNPFYLQLLALREEPALIDKGNIYQSMYDSFCGYLSEEELKFLKFYALLDHSYSLNRLIKGGFNEEVLKKLIKRGIIEINDQQLCEIRQLTKEVVTFVTPEDEKKSVTLDIISFLSGSHENALDLLVLARKLFLSGSMDKLAELMDDYIDLWSKKGVNGNDLVKMLETLISIKGKKTITKKLLVFYILHNLKIKNFEKICTIVEDFKREPVFTEFLYWFYGLAKLEMSDFEEVKSIIVALSKGDSKLKLRGEILASLCDLKMLKLEDAIDKAIQSVGRISDPKTFEAELKLLFSILFTAYNELKEFEKAEKWHIKIKELKIFNDNLYSQLVYEINELQFVLNRRTFLPEEMDKLEQLEKKIKLYFFFDLETAFNKLKCEFLLKTGHVSEASDLFKKEREKLTKKYITEEESHLLAAYVNLSLDLENYELSEELINKIAIYKDPYCIKVADSMRIVLGFKKSGVLEGSKSDEIHHFYHLFENPKLDFKNKPDWLKKVGENDFETAFQNLAEDYNSRDFSDFSFERLAKLNSLIVLSLKVFDRSKFQLYFSAYSKLVEKCNQLPLKWKILKHIYEYLLQENAIILQTLKKYIFEKEVKGYLKKLMIYLFQNHPEMVFEDIMLKMNFDDFKLLDFEEELFNFYFSAFGLLIRKDISFFNGRKFEKTDLFEVCFKIKKKRGIVIDKINLKILSENGQCLITKSKASVLFELLEYLLKNHGKQLGKEELMNNVWKKQYNPLSDDNLIYTSIKRLRDIIEDKEKDMIISDNQTYAFSPASNGYIVQYLEY